MQSSFGDKMRGSFASFSGMRGWWQEELKDKDVVGSFKTIIGSMIFLKLRVLREIM